MAYVARFAKNSSCRLGTVVPSRGDKWYIDPEEIRQYDAPFHIKHGGSFPHSKGPNASYEPYLFPSNPYPRMPFAHRQLKSNAVKYDFGDGIRRNIGETLHIQEDWLLPQGGEWYRDNGTTNNWWGMTELFFFFGVVYCLYQYLDYMDKEHCWTFAAPKVYPFDNLWVEQGGNNQVVQEDRPYVARRIFMVSPEQSTQF